MVIYNPKDWFKLIFQFHKSDTFRMLVPAMLAVGIYTGIICYIEIEVFAMKYKSTTIVHSLLGFVISLLLVFRTNTAYDRWWEGRRQWGSLLNNSRNLAIKIETFISASAENNEVRSRLAILIGNYAFALKEHLRDNIITKDLETYPGFSGDKFKSVTHIPNSIATEIYRDLNKLYKEQQISGEQLITLNEEAKALTDITGACERIKKTPIPYSYSLFIKKFIFLYVMTMPFGFVSDFGFWTVAITILVFYVLTSLELIAEEIEDPFGMDSNDLPTDDIAKRIRSNVKEIITVNS